MSEGKRARNQSNNNSNGHSSKSMRFTSSNNSNNHVKTTDVANGKRVPTTTRLNRLPKEMYDTISQMVPSAAIAYNKNTSNARIQALWRPLVAEIQKYVTPLEYDLLTSDLADLNNREGDSAIRIVKPVSQTRALEEVVLQLKEIDGGSRLQTVPGTGGSRVWKPVVLMLENGAFLRWTRLESMLFAVYHKIGHAHKQYISMRDLERHSNQEAYKLQDWVQQICVSGVQGSPCALALTSIFTLDILEKVDVFAFNNSQLPNFGSVVYQWVRREQWYRNFAAPENQTYQASGVVIPEHLEEALTLYKPDWAPRNYLVAAIKEATHMPRVRPYGVYREFLVQQYSLDDAEFTEDYTTGYIDNYDANLEVVLDIWKLCERAGPAVFRKVVKRSDVRLRRWLLRLVYATRPYHEWYGLDDGSKVMIFPQLWDRMWPFGQYELPELDGSDHPPSWLSLFHQSLAQGQESYVELTLPEGVVWNPFDVSQHDELDHTTKKNQLREAMLTTSPDVDEFVELWLNGPLTQTIHRSGEAASTDFDAEYRMIDFACGVVAAIDHHLRYGEEVSDNDLRRSIQPLLHLWKTWPATCVEQQGAQLAELCRDSQKETVVPMIEAATYFIWEFVKNRHVTDVQRMGTAVRRNATTLELVKQTGSVNYPIQDVPFYLAEGEDPPTRTEQQVLDPASDDDAHTNFNHNANNMGNINVNQ